jgi:hypothetical protein
LRKAQRHVHGTRIKDQGERKKVEFFLDFMRLYGMVRGKR